MEDYWEALTPDQAKVLQKLRQQILATVPNCEEYFGYGLPGFKYRGHPLVYIGAAKSHFALYGSVPPGFTEKLKEFKISKGAIQFTKDKPLPVALVKAILKAMMDQVDENSSGRKRNGPEGT